MAYFYLRLATLFLTISLIDNGFGNEGNLWMKHIEDKKQRKSLWFWEALKFAVIAYVAFYHFFAPMMFLLIFFLWIDFQHDWELYNFIKNYKKHKEAVRG